MFGEVILKKKMIYKWVAKLGGGGGGGPDTFKHKN